MSILPPELLNVYKKNHNYLPKYYVENENTLKEIYHTTNLSIPYSKYIKISELPEQDMDLILSFQKLKYRNYYYTEASSRDIEEEEMYDRDNNIFEDDFLILRADKTEPYVMIGFLLKELSTSNSSKAIPKYIILISDVRKYNDKVHIYPLQDTDNFNFNFDFFDDDFLKKGQLTIDFYNKENDLFLVDGENDFGIGKIIRQDCTEPLQSVILDVPKGIVPPITHIYDSPIYHKLILIRDNDRELYTRIMKYIDIITNLCLGFNLILGDEIKSLFGKVN